MEGVRPVDEEFRDWAIVWLRARLDKIVRLVQK